MAYRYCLTCFKIVPESHEHPTVEVLDEEDLEVEECEDAIF